MKATLLVRVALACSLASAASAQKPTSAPTKPAPGARSTLIAVPPSLGAPGTSAFVGPNDLCGSATAIVGPATVAFDNVGAGTDGPTACGVFLADVWFDFTATSTAPHVIKTCGLASFDTVIAVYATAACVGAPIVCNNDGCGLQSSVTISATSGSVYKIRLGGHNGATGTGSLSISVLPPPANDGCATPALISGSGPHAFNNLAATTGAQGQTEGPCSSFGQTAIQKDLWFKWTAGFTGTARVSSCGQTFVDTKIGVYPGTPACPPNGTVIGCSDDSCSLQSAVDFACTNGTSYTIQLGGFPGAAGGTGTFTIGPPPPPPANDACTTPTNIAGAGPHAFDSSAATTGTQGQTESLCNVFGSMTIGSDQWYRWTAGASGLATLAVCGQSAVDTKAAVYPGSPQCPTVGTALACNDDACATQSRVCFNVTSGQSYTIQIGTFPGSAGGTGTFGITVASGTGNVCQLDDGSSENSQGWAAGGEMAWIQRFGSGGVTNLNNVQVAWGSAAFPGLSPGNGTPVKVLVYDDPNNDGNPNDLVLVQQINTTVSNVDTDILNVYPVTPVAVNGLFFVGASEVHAPGQFVAVMDQNSCTLGDFTYFFGNNTGAPLNYANPAANLFPPDSFAANGFPCNLLVRANCPLSPMVQNCFPGTGSIINCPCGQPANPVGGCANFGATATSGARLNASGTPSLAADTLILTTSNHRTAPAAGILNVFFASTGTTAPNGVANGAGVRCYNLVLKRLYTGQTNPPASGSLSKPAVGDPSVSVRSAALSSPISAGQTRHYFNLYRDSSATAPSACNNTLSNVNVTNAGSVLWTP